jgi:hypothetical protein
MCPPGFIVFPMIIPLFFIELNGFVVIVGTVDMWRKASLDPI